ncbi:MAG: WYL domain-containing protein [Clostridia bacterium]|nr:WYL domain-containing protein [Clostridia bacterium]
MAKGQNQKAKLLYLARILSQQTDQEHPMTIARMMDLLQAQGIDVRDRKSLYDDLETLRVFGMDIEKQREGRSVGYYVAGREFELPELKLLVDAVQSSRFITRKKTDQLIRKVEALASIHQARQLQRQVFVTRRIKAMNESIYYTVDALHEAIDSGKQIRFHYFEWALGRGRERVEKRLRKNGDWYRVSPWWLIWDNENYYLVAFDQLSRDVRHYRVDKMQDLEIVDELREGKELLASFDPGAYAGSLFGMYHGQLETVKIRFENSLIGVVADRFGREVFLSPDGDGHFTVTAQVAVSPQFLSWVFSFGPQAELLSPEPIRQQFLQLLHETEANYQ